MKNLIIVTVVLFVFNSTLLAQSQCQDASQYIEVSLTPGSIQLCNSQAYTVTVTNSSDKPVKVYVSVYNDDGTRARIHGGVNFKSVPPYGSLTYKDETNCNHKVGPNVKWRAHFEDSKCYGYEFIR